MLVIRRFNHRQTENNRVSVKEFISKLDDIKRDKDKIKEKDERTKHQLVQIPPTERKKWPQKSCVYCRKIKFTGIQDTYVLLVIVLSVKTVFLTIMRKLKNIFYVNFILLL